MVSNRNGPLCINWVYKTNLQPKFDQSLDHGLVDCDVIQPNDEKYWLYAAVDSETNHSIQSLNRL